MEEGLRRQIEALQSGVEALLESPASPVRRAEAFGRLGQSYLAFGFFAAAEVAFRNASLSATDDGRWFYYLGVVLQTRGVFDEALAAFEHTTRIRPDDLATWIRLGHLNLDLNRPEAAATAFKKVLGLDPSSAAARYGLGKVATMRGEHADAVALFAEVLELQPEAAVVEYQLGQAYRKLGNLEQAREHLRRRGEEEVSFPDPLGDQVAWLALGAAFEVLQTLAADMDDFSERDFLGFALSQLGDVEGVTEQLREALRIQAERSRELAPGSPEAARDRLVRARIHYALGGLLVRSDADDEAAVEFRSALELAPTLEDARIKLGNVLARAGDPSAAIEEYSSVLERNPGNSAALVKRAAALMSLDRDPSAIADLERLRQLEPGNSEALLRLGMAYTKEGDPEKARTVYGDALELDLELRERAAVHFELGNLLSLEGALDQALQSHAKAVEIDGSLTEARFGLGTIQGRMGRYEEAARTYGEVIEIEGDHELARLGQATALVILGREAEARNRLEEGIEALPKSLALTHALARLLAAAVDRSLRDGARAVELARQAVAALSSLEHAETLAMALAQADRFDEAVQLQRRLVGEAESRGDARVLERLGRELELYEAGRACCG